MDEEESIEFMNNLLEEWVDPQKRDALVASHGSQAEGEEILPNTYPFSKDALYIAAAYACRHGGWTTPRDIQQSLDDLLNRAIDENVHIISHSYCLNLVNA